MFAIFNGEVRKMVEQYRVGLGAVPDDVDDIAKGFSSFLALSADERGSMSEAATSLSSLFDRKRIVSMINSHVWYE